MVSVAFRLRRASILCVAVLLASRASAVGYEAVAVPDGGTIAGVVRVAAPLPAPLPPLDVFKNKTVCGDTVPSEALVVAADGALRYAVVTLDVNLASTFVTEAVALKLY